MLALVTGATGFLGRHVVRALGSQGAEVRCLIRNPDSAGVLEGQQVEIHYGSVADPAALRAAFYGMDVVVHLVAVIRESGSATFDEVNLRGTENVVAAAKAGGARQFIYISAIGAADDPTYPYLHSKWKAEQAVIGSGLPYTILRPSVVFGLGDGFVNLIAGLVRAFPIVPVVGSGRNRFQPIAVGEVARCIAAAANNEDLMNRVVEIGGPTHLSYNDIVDIIAKTYRVRRFKLHVPISAMLPVTRLMEALLPSPPATTHQIRMIAVPNVADLSTVEEVFGFKPQPLEGNIGYTSLIGVLDGLRMALGMMPRRIRDH